jgi:hypothetical protein
MIFFRFFVIVFRLVLGGPLRRFVQKRFPLGVLTVGFGEDGSQLADAAQVKTPSANISRRKMTFCFVLRDVRR